MIGASRAASTRAYQVLSTTTITSTGTQEATIPAGTVFVEIEMYGGGGGSGRGTFSAGGGKGGGSAQNNSGSAGGGGAYVKHRLRITDLRAGDKLTFDVGAGGSGTAHPARPAGSGEDTQLLTHKRDGADPETQLSFVSDDIIAGGGNGGRSGNGFAQSSDGDGGVAQNGNITNTNGSDGAAKQAGGASAVDGGAGGDAGGPDGGDGGNGGTTSNPGLIAAAGTAPGGGAGSGASITNTSGAAGANGRVIVKAFG